MHTQNRYHRYHRLVEQFPQSLFISGITLRQVQKLALGLAEPHSVHIGPLFKPVEVSLDGILFLINCITQFGVICRLESALSSTVYVIDKDIKRKYSPLRDTAHHWSPPGHKTIDHNSLSASIQTIIYPLKSTSFKSIPLQFEDRMSCGTMTEALKKSW